MRFIILLLVLSVSSCLNLSKDWQKNHPSYKYAPPPYLNQPYNPYTPRVSTPYRNNNPYMNQYPSGNAYGYNPHDYDSQYREPYRYNRNRTFRTNDVPNNYYPPVDNDQSYYYNYPPRQQYNNPSYNNQYQGQQQQSNPNDINDYEVAR